MHKKKLPSSRVLSYCQAIRDALDVLLARSPKVFLIGEGVPDVKGILGTTIGLAGKYGPKRVMDMPLSENALTGVVIGAALRGLRPILIHQRLDFSLLAIDELVNNAAKWFAMFGGIQSVPLVIRMVIGRGWGQGAQHSQSLSALFAHIPGLKVIVPTTPYDAKGMLIAAVEDPNPVIMIEHRWLYNLTGQVPQGYYTVPIGVSQVVREGRDVTVAATSFMTVESLKAAQIVDDEAGISVEVIDIRTLSPFDRKPVLDSVGKTGRLLVTDIGYRHVGFAGEVIATVTEHNIPLSAAPRRITLPDAPTPTSWSLAKSYYPTYRDIIRAILVMVGMKEEKIQHILAKHQPSPDDKLDIPDASFTGPF